MWDTKKKHEVWCTSVVVLVLAGDLHKSMQLLQFQIRWHKSNISDSRGWRAEVTLLNWTPTGVPAFRPNLFPASVPAWMINMCPTGVPAWEPILEAPEIRNKDWKKVRGLLIMIPTCRGLARPVLYLVYAHRQEYPSCAQVQGAQPGQQPGGSNTQYNTSASSLWVSYIYKQSVATRNSKMLFSSIISADLIMSKLWNKLGNHMRQINNVSGCLRGPGTYSF